MLPFRTLPLTASTQLSAVLVVVAINMGEWRNFGALSGLPEGEVSVFLTAFLLTVLTDVTVAVEAGVALSALLYLKRVADATDVARPVEGADSGVVAAGVSNLSLSGALLFGATDALAQAASLASADPRVRVLLLDCSRLIAVDATGLEAVEEAHKALHKAGKHLVLSGVHRQPHAALSNAGLLKVLGYASA